MSTYASPLPSGKSSPKGFLRVLGKIFTGNGIIEDSALTVSAQDTPDMTVKVTGSALDDNAVFIHSDGTFVQAWNEADELVTITANASGVTKTDAIVAYVDMTDFDASNPNNPDSLKFIAVRRAGADTGAPTSGEIETAVSNNPYTKLSHVAVSNGASSINSGNLTDQRTLSQVAKEMIEPLDSEQIGDDEVKAANIDWVSTGANGGIWWEEVGRTTQSVAGGSITVSFTAKKYLRILAYIIPSASSATNLQFNGSSTNIYAYRRTTDGGAEANANTTSAISLAGANAVKKYITIDLTGNITADEKIVFFTLVDAAAGVANTPERTIGSGKWVNTSAQVSSVQILVSSGNVNIGSEIIVLGHD